MKRITITIPDELLKWIEDNIIKKKRFHNYPARGGILSLPRNDPEQKEEE